MPQPRGKSWKARPREGEETVQARTAGITDLGAERVVADKAETYWPRLEGLALWFLRNANCQGTYELLNKWSSNASRTTAMSVLWPVKMFSSALMMILFLLAPVVAGAQPRMPQVGILIPDMGRSQSQMINGLRDELKTLGYQERKNIFLEMQNVKGDRGALQAAVSELIARKVDIVFTTGTRATQVAKSATRDIPIVFIHPADPISLGLAKSMDGSGTNLTGVGGFGLQTTEKRLAILKEIIPNLQRVHIFYDANDKFARENFAYAKAAGETSRLQVAGHGVKSLEEFKTTLGGLQKRDGDALFHVPDDTVESAAEFIFDTARQKKLPTMFNDEAWAIKGAMAAYGPSYYEMGRQAARLVDMMIKGRKPESLPIQRANKFDLVLNYRTARFIGVTFSRDMLKKADRVIR